MFKGLDEVKTKKKVKPLNNNNNNKTTNKPLIKFACKDAKLSKRKVIKNAAMELFGPNAVSLGVVAKIKGFCDLIQASDLNRDRLTEYIARLDTRGTAIELSAWSTSQLMHTNIVRTVTSKPSPQVDKKRKRNRTVAEEYSTLFWILTIMVDSERMTNNGNKRIGCIKKKDALWIPVPNVPQVHSDMKLLSEYIIFKLWLIVRYVFSTVLSAATTEPRVLVPLFVVKFDGRSMLGRAVKEQMTNSFRNEVSDLKKPFRCSFVW